MLQNPSSSHFDSDDEEFVYTASGSAIEDTSERPHSDNGSSSEPGDYSARLDEILSDDDKERHAQEEDDDEGGFLYTGRDADELSGGYHDQLKDVLDDEHEVLSDGSHSLLQQKHLDKSQDRDDWVGQDSSYFTALNDPELDRSPSPPHPADTLDSADVASLDLQGEQVRPFLHPSISRLRSGLQTSSPQKNLNSDYGLSLLAEVPDQRGLLLSPESGIASISRTSSTSNLVESMRNDFNTDAQERAAFKWTSLRTISDMIFRKTSEKASAVLGPPVYGSPTVLAVNGLICIGTNVGKVCVFDFKQRLICVCGDEQSEKSFGSVTAVAISRDHTFVACGHVHGHIQLFDLKRPNISARTVYPTSIAAVASGRSEGHIQGSRIISIGFIAGRHTAIISADSQGLAFYHSLGKVLFMDANDCLRILGKYPVDDFKSLASVTRRTDTLSLSPAAADPSNVASSSYASQRKISPILAMVHLPLGVNTHPTDSYQLIALITPSKLVVVGLKPAPKTWFRRHREEVDEHMGTSRWRGCLAWFPSVANNSSEAHFHNESSSPLLAYSWGSVVTILRVRESRVSHKVKNEKTGKVEKVESGKINFDEYVSYNASSSVLAIQWLNVNQIILFTASSIEILDVRNMQIIETFSFDASKLVSLAASLSPAQDIQHSTRTYKGKIFILGLEDVMIGTLLTWADRILSFVEQGDFLNAITLAREFYLGQAKGNKNGLPEDESEMRMVVGQKLKELMDASSRYAFSEDRFTDATHISPDNRGVDRTSLFEDLVTVCASACCALDDFDFLFEDLFQYYDDSGISAIYLRQLEPFILDDRIHNPPARITQRLIAMHDKEGSRGAAERLIWHIDPDCLDINQVLTLCRKYRLYDAMIYINNTALRDYTTPLIEFLLLIRNLLRERKGRYSEQEVQPSRHNAYKIFAYLSNILCGLTYPSGKPLPAEDALKAQNDIYSFLFHGRSQTWPGEGNGKLVLTADEEGGVEPTYPYARLLLRFDAEAFLHILDLAFEQSYLNECETISRQIIVKIMMDIAATSKTPLPPTDITFINIFIARNVPKYPQFIHMAPSSLQNLLIGLAVDTDSRTREDRQLAAEFLLSAYTPHDSERIIQLFEEARFYRILRSWYKQDRQWTSLLQTYMHDSELDGIPLFQNVEEVLNQASRFNTGILPDDLIAIMSDSVGLFLSKSISRTAFLFDRYVPSLHTEVIRNLDNNVDDKRLSYLRCLLGRPGLNEDIPRTSGPSTSVGHNLQLLYVELLCRFDPANVLAEITYLREKVPLRVDEIIEICENAQLYDVVIWLMNERGATASMAKYETFSRTLSHDLGIALVQAADEGEALKQSELFLMKLTALYRMGIRICCEHSQQTAAADAPVEDLWFTLLATQIDAVQTASSTYPQSNAFEDILTALRSLVQASLTELVAVSTAMTVSFPRLFKRLVDVTGQTRTQAGTPYHEFRNILSGMLSSYRSEEDLLVMSKRIADADFFDTYDKLMQTRLKGWNAISPICSKCRAPLKLDSSATKGDSLPGNTSIAVSPNGIYHSFCISSTA